MADKAQLDPRVKERLKVLVIWLAVVIALLVGQSFLWNGVKSAAVRLHDMRSQSQQIKQVKEDFLDINDKFQSQSAFLDQLSVVVPLKRDTLQLIERLEGVAAGLSLNIVINDIVEGSEVEEAKDADLQSDSAKVLDESIGIIPFTASISLSGPPERLLSFVESVEHIQEITHISLLNIVAGSSRGTEDDANINNTYNATMDVVFYLQTNKYGE